jgi:MFS family permease
MIGGTDPAPPGDTVAQGGMSANAARMARRAELVPYIVGAAVLAQTIDATAIAIALPSMAREFGVDPVAASRAITAYFIGMALTVPVGGWLGDRFGGRNVLRVAILILIATSLVCAAAPSLPVMVAARFVSGLASSVVLPVARLMTVRAALPGRTMQAITTFATVGVMGPLLGPVVSGLFVALLSWRAIFLGIAGLGVLAIVAVTLACDDDRQPTTAALDWRGLAISGSGLACLVSGMEMLGHEAAMPFGLGLMVAGWLFLVALVLHARRVPHALIRIDLLRHRLLAISILSDFPIRMIVTAGPMLVSLLLQVGLGHGALISGILMLTPAVGNLGLKPVLALGARTIGIPASMALGGLLAASAFASLVLLGPDSWLLVLVVPLVLHGLGRALVVSGGTVLNYTGMAAGDMGSVTGLSSVFQQIASVMGVAVAALMLRMFADGSLDLAAIRAVVLVMAGIGLLSIVALLARTQDAPEGPTTL